ncbi:hypothetical protein [Oceanirhabdus sp. W0125-5]|uniref:hypothetical protein n=1 Tax=Oceanirhabdus sp. W0125-5 TaxID=2999116 RepID=UPI0022F2D801|nr:hypothetical protein [Oceanirhabdus sp. W0125-5]WBW96318.1 hypothetical protein OW730_21880 [Oceanirhabdus sp. W0125-5]
MKVVAMPIDVVAWFDKEGIPHPVRFRITTKDCQEQVVKIHKIMTRDLEKLAGNRMHIFNCTSVINGIERGLQIKYEIDTCKWMLFKI